MAISKLILNGEVQMDVTSDTVEANKLLSGETATKNDGTKVTGTYIPPDPVISSLTIAPTESQQTFNEVSISGYKPVTVGAIASDYIGSAIPMRSSEDVYFNGSQARVPSGYYSNNASQYISTVSATAWVSFESSTGTISGGVSVYSPGYLDGGKQTMSDVPILSAKTITPTESVQYISSYRWLTGSQTIAAISSEYIGSAVPKKSSTDLTANGSTVTAPAGYYSTAATKNISGGSAIPPAVTITKAPTFTMNSATGVVTASYSGSSTVTPTVTAGYISQGTAGTISTSGTSTYQLTSKAAATIYPSTADQTISSYRWLTGTQTIKSVTTSNLTAANIKSGVVVRVGDATNSSRITQITGTYSATTPTISALTVTPTTTTQTFNATGVSGYKPVTVNAIPSSYIIPTGTSSITSNGVYDIGSYASVDVNVGGGGSTSMPYRIGYFVSRMTTGVQLASWSGHTARVYGTIGDQYYGPGDSAKTYYIDKYFDIGNTAWTETYSFGARNLSLKFNSVGSNASPGLLTYIGYASLNITIMSDPIPYADMLILHTLGNNTSLTTSMEEISGTRALAGYWDLEYFSGANVTTIYGEAFRSCTALRSIFFPKASFIGGSAFAECANLQSIEFPLATSVGDSAFCLCSFLRSVSMPLLESTGAYTFANCPRLDNIYLPNIEFLGNNTFTTCAALSRIDSASFPKLSTISFAAFYSCSGLSYIDLPTVTIVSGSAFASCAYLITASFLSCETIGVSAFSGCTRLQTVIAPKCQSIQQYAFSKCYSLISLYLTSVSSVPTLAGAAFTSTPIGGYSTSAGQYGSVYVPASLYNDFLTATNWSAISSRIVSVL